MPWTIITPVFIYLIITIPLFFLFWIKKPVDKLTKLLIFVVFFLYNLLWYFTVNWAVVNYHISYLPFISSLLIAIYYLLDLRRTPNIPGKTKVSLFITTGLIVITGLLGYASYRVVYLSYRHTGEHVLLLFPLRQGLYTVVNGGNGLDGIGMNNHLTAWFTKEFVTDPEMVFGIDVMKMGIAGMISTNQRILPSELIRYEIYNDTVYSPCFGPVIHVEDGHPNLQIPDKGGDHLGNYVVIQCVDYFVFLSNLKSGSIIVTPGERLTPNRIVAQVGNSASPGIPHLHIHAKVGGWREGEGTPVPMLFDGAFAVNDFQVRNEILIR
jgi:hypothetical protein